MPETSADAPSASPMDSLGYDDTKMREVTASMASNTREKISATDKVYGDFERTTDRLLPRIEKLSKDVGVEAGNLKPWNADEEAAKRHTDPIEAFGSIGSVFGILASAFTHAPMENALNASAAAMNSIKQGDDKSYERAYKAWQDNTKQALDRHKIQHDAYQDAVSLLSTNMSVANTKLQVLAARFGDKQALALLDSGMNKDLMELFKSRQDMALKLAEQMPKIEMANAELSRLYALGFDSKNPTNEESQAALQKFKQEKVDWAQAEHAFTPEQQAFLKFKKEKPDATADETAEYVDKLRTRSRPLTPEQEAVNTFLEQNPQATAEEVKQFVIDLRAKSRPGAAPRFNTDQEIIKALEREHVEAGKPPPTAAEIAEAVRKAKAGAGGGNTSLTKDRQIAKDVDELVEKYKKDNPDATPDDVAKYRADQFRKLGTAAAAPSGNRLDDLRSLRDRATMMTDTIDKVEGLLVKHKALTGLGGTVTRPMEVVGNWFGSNETDRAQFKRYISELQEWGTRVLNESKGRPLSAEVTKLNNILPGLAFGDTTANTVRAYRELKDLLPAIQKQLDSRIGSNWKPAEPGSFGGKPAKKPSWANAPVVE